MSNSIYKGRMNRKIAIGFIGVAIVLLVFGAIQPVSATFTKKAPIHINNTGGSALTDYQVMLNITYDSDMNSNFSDIRVVNETSGEAVPYWIENKSDGDWCKLWFNASYIPANSWCNDTYYLYYGNPSASSVSDGDATFEFFDDGEGDKEGVPKASLTIGSSVGFSGVCPRVVVADNGTWLMIFRLREDGSYPSGHEGQVWLSKSYDNGETWSEPVKLSNDTYDAINAEFVKYPNGDIEIFYTRYDQSTSTYHEPNMVSRSTDNGETWSDFEEAPSPLNSDYQVMWQEVIVGSTVYLAAHKRDIDTGYKDCLFYKSTDNGNTWTQVGTITSHASDGNYTEPGLVYLGNGEFVCVLRDNNKECTLQKRSTDWGQTWTTDGYIKSDGSVNPDKDAGTNVVLHQCKMWNKDKNGNNLGYIYMKAALYPGSYPRDEYGYISTDNCSSWVSRNVLREDVGGEAGIVFKNNSFAKHFSAGNPITNDDLDITEEYLLSDNGWTVNGGTYKYDDSKKYTGSMSLYGNAHNTQTAYQDFTNPSEDGSAILEFDMYDNGGTFGAAYLAPPNGEYSDGILLGYYDAHSPTYYCINYYDDSGYISLTDVPTRSVGWHHFKMEVKPDGSAEFTVDGVKSSITASAGELDNVGRVYIRDYDNSETWWDRIRVRKYASPEPSALLGAEQSIGGECTAPTISSLTNSTPSTNSVTITWTTNQSADNRVKYSKNSDLSNPLWSSWANDTNSVSITLTGLEANTTYYYQAWSYNGTNSSCYTVEPSSQPYRSFTTQSESGNASVSVSDGSINFGNLQLNTVKNTVDIGDTQIISTTGADGAQKIEIKLNSSTVTGINNGTTLTFVTGSPGTNEIKCEFKGGDVSSYTALTDAYQTFDDSMAKDTNANLDIQLTTPSAVSNDNYYDNYQFEIIIKATLL